MTDVIRCHRCGTSKGLEDKGIYVAWIFGTEKKYRSIAWFHNTECKDTWKLQTTLKVKELNNGATETGLIPILDDKDQIKFSDDNDEL